MLNFVKNCCLIHENRDMIWAEGQVSNENGYSYLEQQNFCWSSSVSIYCNADNYHALLCEFYCTLKCYRK